MRAQNTLSVLLIKFDFSSPGTNVLIAIVVPPASALASECTLAITSEAV